MTCIISKYADSLILIAAKYIDPLILAATNPVSMTHFCLAAVHLIIMRCYIGHPDGRPLAVCAALTSILYIFLALQHGLAQ